MATDPSKYKFNHTMLRVKNPEASIKYYEFLGLSQIAKVEGPGTTTYYMAYTAPKSVSQKAHATDREGVVALQYTHGSESDPSFTISNGNSEPGRGFGHTCISVDNIQAACKRIEDAGYKFQKKLTDGRMRHIAFALDPDGYWVEIVSWKDVEKTAAETDTEVGEYRFNHSMFRIKDPKVSLPFYENAFGMSLLRRHDAPEAKFNNYFLGYGAPPAAPNGDTALREGILELCWNYGTEDDAAFAYYNGNPSKPEDPKGFRCIGVSVDDLASACERLKKLGVGFEKEGEGEVLAKDPDGYWIRLVQNEGIKV